MVIKEYNDSNPNTDRDMIISHQLIYDPTLDVPVQATNDNNKWLARLRTKEFLQQRKWLACAVVI
jgi:hypothetical protein